MGHADRRPPTPADLDRMRVQEQNIVESLITPGGVETLVESGRIPVFLNPSNPKDPVLLVVPPEGVQAGTDTFHLYTGLGGVPVFLSPEGKDRGHIDLLTLTADQATALRTRIDSARVAPSSPIE